MGGPVFPSAIYLGPNYGGGNEDNGDLTQKTPCMPCYSSCPQPHTFTGKSPVGSLFLSPGFWCRGSVVPSKSLFPSPMQVQAAPWWGQRWPPPRGRMQYPHPEALSWGRPPLTRTSTGDTQTQFCLSLCGVPGSWCAQGLFEPFECLWREWGLILNVNLPLLPSFWNFSFALGRGVSPHSCSSAYCLTGISLTLDVGYLRITITEN